MRPSLNRILFALGAALGLGATGAGGYRLWTLLDPPQTITVEPPPGCELHRADCRASLPGGGELRLALAPRPIPLAQTIALAVEFTGLGADSVEADISSLDMIMGYHRRTLAPDGPNRFRAETVLAICTRETMRWRLTVIVRSGRTTYRVPFAFETVTRTARPS